MQKIEKLIVHHTATPTSWTVEDVRRLHVEERGWDDIGYHYLILLNDDGTARMEIGRPCYKTGAHAKGHNRNSLGLCTVGNWSKGEMPRQIRRELVRWLDVLCQLHDLDPLEAIKGHRELEGAATECPGNYVDLNAIRREVVNRMDGFTS